MVQLALSFSFVASLEACFESQYIKFSIDVDNILFDKMLISIIHNDINMFHMMRLPKVCWNTRTSAGGKRVRRALR